MLILTVVGLMMSVGKRWESVELAGLGTSYTRHLHIFCVSNRPPFHQAGGPNQAGMRQGEEGRIIREAEQLARPTLPSKTINLS